MDGGRVALEAFLMAEEMQLASETAERMIGAGLWKSMRRGHKAFCDSLEIYLADRRQTMASVGVLPSRLYFYMNHRTSEVYLADSFVAVLERLIAS